MLDLIIGIWFVFDLVFIDIVMLIVFTLCIVVNLLQVCDFIEVMLVVFGYVDFVFVGLLHKLIYEGVLCTVVTIRNGIYFV